MSSAREPGHVPAGGGKGTTDYLRAFKRRWWMIVLTTGLVGAGGTAFTLHQKPVYRASSRILIEPPRAVVSGLGEDRTSNALVQSFFNTRVQMIASRQIAERVLNSLQLSDWDQVHGVDDPIASLQGWLEVKPVLNSSLVDVAVEGNDAALVAKIVNTTIDEFLRYEHEGLQEQDQAGRSRIDAELRGLEGLAGSSAQALNDFQRKHPHFLRTGESLEAGKLTVLEEAKAQAELRVKAAKREVEKFEALRKIGAPLISPRAGEQVAMVKEQVRQLDEELARQKELLRPERYELDRAVRALRERRDQLENSLSGVGTQEAEIEAERLKQEVKFAEADLDNLRKLADQQRAAVLGQQDDYNRLTSLITESTRHETIREFLARKKLEADIQRGLTSPRIQVIDRASTPQTPIRPIKILQIPLSFAVGLVLGCLLVVGLEFCDGRIRRPEQALAWLDWPLLAVVPKAPRRRLFAGGRLRMISDRPDPGLVEVFRNLRTGILAQQAREELRSIVITSAATGEGKSLTAAQLAVACARAGERVLLVDMDLRRPTVDRLMGVPAGRPGLADVLAAGHPWKDAVARGAVANLDVLTAGCGGVPADVVGTVEMVDLLSEWTESYDRVLLDGPACLGLADARVVGQFADGVLFVVRSALHDYRPLARSRELFEQEGLRPIGVVFNALRGAHVDVSSARPAVRRPAARPAARPTERMAARSAG